MALGTDPKRQMEKTHGLVGNVCPFYPPKALLQVERKMSKPQANSLCGS